MTSTFKTLGPEGPVASALGSPTCPAAALLLRGQKEVGSAAPTTPESQLPSPAPGPLTPPGKAMGEALAGSLGQMETDRADHPPSRVLSLQPHEWKGP